MVKLECFAKVSCFSFRANTLDFQLSLLIIFFLFQWRDIGLVAPLAWLREFDPHYRDGKSGLLGLLGIKPRTAGWQGTTVPNGSLDNDNVFLTVDNLCKNLFDSFQQSMMMIITCEVILHNLISFVIFCHLICNDLLIPKL